MILIVGPPGTGKTPLCSRIAGEYSNKTGNHAICVSQIPKKVANLSRMGSISLKALKAFKNGLLVFDDALVNLDSKLIETLRAKDAIRHHDRAIYVCVYHSFGDIPMDLKRAAHAVYAIKTGEAEYMGYTNLLRRACRSATDKWQLFT